MGMTVLRIAVTACLLGLTGCHEAKLLTVPPLNYNGIERINCPSSSYKGNQPADRTDTTMQLQHLRNEMTRPHSAITPIDAYIITSDDEHQSDTVDKHDRRREYVTGFTGSAGIAVVTNESAVLWTDGRYHLQANQQLSCEWKLMTQGHDDIPTLTEWLKFEFQSYPIAHVAADAKLVPAFTWDAWERDLANSTIELVTLWQNLVDVIWVENRTNYTPYPAYPLPLKYAGRPWREKVQEVRREMSLVSADALVITALDEIAWLFNIRGYDLPFTPVLKAYAVISHDSIDLWAPKVKLTALIKDHLGSRYCRNADCVKLRNDTDFWYDLRTFAQPWKIVWLPAPCGYAQGASQEIFSTIPAEKQLAKASPIIALRAKKNEVEIRGMEEAHVRDGVAMCNFLAYLEDHIDVRPEGWAEMDVVRVANEFRLEQKLAKSTSFPTIAGYGRNAALPHYEPVESTNQKIGKDSTLVIDSGGQYSDGTTDVTRTLHFGEPTEEHKKAYTRVLIGSIQLASLVFPSDLRTDQLDALARGPLWNAGLDYLHGTGHGIGHFLSVHEAPISVSYVGENTNPSCNPVQLKPGFFLSNEPGYYKEGDFGVRLENVLEVKEAKNESLEHHSRQKFLRFKEITLVPYEPKLMIFEMLSPSHRRWLNDYNQRIRDVVGPEMKRQRLMDGYKWMLRKTHSIPLWDNISGKEFLALVNSHPSNFKHSYLLVIVTVILQFYSGILRICS